MLTFAQIRASTVAAASTEALPVSVRRKLRSGVSMRRTQAVFWENGPPVSSLTSASSASGLFGRGGSHVSIRDLDDVTRL